jgi:hypothetical protein
LDHELKNLDKDKNVGSSPTTLRVATVRTNEPKNTYLFVNLAGSVWCGSSGCSLSIYKVNKGKHTLLEDISADVFYVQNCPNHFYFINQGSKGFFRKSLSPNEDNLERFDTLSDVPNCNN